MECVALFNYAGSFYLLHWGSKRGPKAGQDQLGSSVLAQRARPYMPTYPKDGEPKERYCRRRNRAVADHAEGAGIDIISDWSLSLVRWLEHLQRFGLDPGRSLATSFASFTSKCNDGYAVWTWEAFALE